MKASILLCASRQAKLADMLRERGELRLRDIIADLGVTRATAQRDLKMLAQQSWIKRTHGGVVLVDEAGIFPPASKAICLEDRQSIGQDAKYRLGQAAVDILQGTATLYIDAGTTTLAFTQALINASWRPIWVVTNSWHIAELLCRTGIRHELLGGEVDPSSLAISGTTALQTINSFRFDWAVLSVDAITTRGETRVARPPEAYLKRAAAQASARRMLLAHAEKFRADSHFEVSPLSMYDCWLVDRADDDMQQLCAATGVRLHVC